MPSIGEKIQELMAELGVNQSGLAKALDLTEGSVSFWVSGRSKPNPAVCLILAGLTKNEADLQFFVEASGLSLYQLSLIYEVSGRSQGSTGNPEIPVRLMPMVRALVDLYEHQGSPLIEKFKGLLPEMLQADEFRHVRGVQQQPEKKKRRPA
jgi:transcriptional regulator with XRE-family HTH domain